MTDPNSTPVGDSTPAPAAETYRFTLTVTPLTDAEMQTVVNDMRARFGRKPLIHIIGRQASGTPLGDAPQDGA